MAQVRRGAAARTLGDVVDKERGLALAVTSYLTSQETTWLRAASRASAAAFVRHCPVQRSLDEVYIETRRDFADSETYRVPGRNAASPLYCWKLVVPPSVLGHLDASFSAPRDDAIDSVGLRTRRMGLMQIKDELKRTDLRRSELALSWLVRTKGGLALRFATRELAQNKDLVLLAVTSTGMALDFADPRMQADRDVVAAAVANDGRAVRFASPRVQTLALCRSAVERAGGALRSLPFSLRSDPTTVTTAVRNDGLALMYASLALRENRDVVAAAVQQNGLALKHVAAGLRGDPAVVSAAIAQNGYALRYAAAGLKADRWVVSTAVRSCPEALEHADENLRRDVEFVMPLIEEDVAVLRYTHDSLRNDLPFVMAVAKTKAMALRHGGPALRADRGFVRSAVLEDGALLGSLPFEFRQDRDVVRAATTTCPKALAHSGRLLRGDIHIVLEACERDVHVARYAGANLCTHDDFNRTLRATFGYDLWSDKVFVMRRIALSTRHDAVPLDVVMARAHPALKRDAEVMLAAAAMQPAALRRYAAGDLTTDRDFLLAAVEKSGAVLEYVDLSLRRDRGFVLAAVRRNAEAVRYADPALVTFP